MSRPVPFYLRPNELNKQKEPFLEIIEALCIAAANLVTKDNTYQYSEFGEMYWLIRTWESSIYDVTPTRICESIKSKK
jgi:hypothetical protein